MTGSQALAGQRLTADWLNLNIPGNWFPVTGQNSWANHGSTSVTFQARQFNSVTLEVIGLIGGGTTTNNTTIGTLPSSLPRAVTVQPAYGLIISGTGAGSTFLLVAQPGGAIQLGQAIAGANEIGFHFFVSLDA